MTRLTTIRLQQRRILFRQLTLSFALLFLASASPSFAQPRAENIRPQKRPPIGTPPGQNSPAATKEGAEDSGTVINVKNADISALIRIFSEKTKRNFILDERVKGKVSLFLPKEITAEESLKILDTVLTLKGFSSVPVGDNLWKIVPSKEAIQSTIPTRTDDSGNEDATSAVVTQLVHLKFINADDAKQILTPLISSAGLINAYTGTNSLIIIDSEDNILRVIDLITSLDVASRGRELTIIPIKYADALDIAQKLQDILGESDSPEASQAADPRTAALNSIRARLRENRANSSGNTNTQAAVSATSSTTVSARALAPKIIADERTNSVIVVADDETTARIRGLVSQLDSETNLSGFRFYVYKCQHASSEELAEVMANLTGQGGTGGGGLGRNNNTGANNPLGLNRNSRNRGGQFASTQNRLGSQNRTPGRSRTENNTGRAGSTTVNFGDDLSITSDPSTNSLIIFSDKDGYEKILSLLEDLDVKPRQVLVEAVLLEVQLDESQTDSVDWQATGGGSDGAGFAQSNFSGNIANIVSNPAALSGFTAAVASAGSITVGDVTIPSQLAILNAARNNNLVNILSSPNILATDNQQAEIVVGQNVPFVASTSTDGQNLNNTFNTVDRQDVGITLRLTPQISSNETVRLDIFTEVSSVLETTASSDLGPTTTIRTSETTTITKSGQMIVIGGLMSDQVTEVDTGIPYLMDVPVLGYFFRSTSKGNRRTNLLIFITARIIKDQFDHRDATKDQRDDFKFEMDAIGFRPPRDEHLFNSDMDKVMKAEDFKGTPPSTIRGKLTKKSAIIPAESSKPTFLELKADIPLPTGGGAKGSQSQPPASASNTGSQKQQQTAPRASFQGQSAGAARMNQPSDGHYILLQVVEKPGSGFNPPFPYGSHVALKLPTAANHLLSKFTAGSGFRYGPSEKGLSLKVDGVFTSQSDAQGMTAGSSGTLSWYTLSPFEIMNFGKGPWYQD